MSAADVRGDIVDRWPDLVDPRTGIVREIRELRLDDDEPAFVHYLSFAASTEAWGMLPNFSDNGGVGADRGTAVRKALGEAVERYCSAVFDEADLVRATWTRLSRTSGPRPVDPASFALYSARQYAEPGFPWRPFDADAPVAWTLAEALHPDRGGVRREPVLVPAAFVFVPFHYRGDVPDTPIAQPISTGLACGAGPLDAAVSAVCETIERDAFTVTWQRRLSRPRWSRESMPAEIDGLLARFEAVGLDVHVVDITTDVGVPTVLTVAEGHVSTSPAVAVAAATSPDPVRACRKSLEELAHTRRFASQVMDYMPPVAVAVGDGHPDVVGQRQHLRFYCPQESKEFASFLWAGPETPFPDVPATAPEPAGAVLARLVAAIDGAGEQVLLRDVTTPDVAGLDLSVVRAVVPGLHPLHMGHGNRARGGSRLSAVPDRIGSSADTDDNPYPHPFP